MTLALTAVEAASASGRRANRPRDLAVGGGLAGADFARDRVDAAPEIVQGQLLEHDVAEVKPLPVAQGHDGSDRFAHGAEHIACVGATVARQRTAAGQSDLGEPVALHVTPQVPIAVSKRTI